MLSKAASSTIFFSISQPGIEPQSPEPLAHLMSRVFPNGLGDWGSILSQVIPKTQKWYSMLPCLTLSITRYWSRVKWSNPRNGVAPFPTPWCSSYQKGSRRVTHDSGCQLYLLIFIILYWAQYKAFGTTSENESLNNYWPHEFMYLSLPPTRQDLT